MSLPVSLDALTPEWLTSVLSERNSTIHVRSARIDDIVWGTTTKVLMHVEYAQDYGPDAPPNALCVKGGFDEKRTQYGLSSAYIREAEFYGHCYKAQLDIPLPRSWYAASDHAGQQGIVILDDLRPLGCVFGENTIPWSVDRVAAGLEVLARLHACTWGARREDYPWLGADIPQRVIMREMMQPSYWDRHWASTDAPAVPEQFLNRDFMLRACTAAWSLEDKAPPVLRHDDCHHGNSYLRPDGSPVFLDWQAVCIGPGVDDATFFLVGALSVADRRAHEKALLRHYLDAVSAVTGSSMDFDYAWQQYRSYQVHGFMWALTGTMFQPKPRIDAMAERYIAGMVDHDVFDALGVRAI